MKIHFLSLMSITASRTTAFAPTSTNTRTSTSLNLVSDRRQILQMPALAILGAMLPSTLASTLPANAATPTTALDGNLPDLPPEASRSYLQYRIPLQIAADYFVFELQPKLSNIDDWGEINQLFQTNNNKGQGQPNKIERDYVNPMRILALSMPPDEAEDLRAAQFKFEKAMQKISKNVQGVRRDLPVEIDRSVVTGAEKGWDDGRLALNEFFAILNGAVGFEELKGIPPAGPNQFKEYGRSPRKFNELMKKTKLCQNRGGPALSQAWGQLMVSGYMQDSCGIPDLEDYFYQS